jgi:hypothetical protein
MSDVTMPSDALRPEPDGSPPASPDPVPSPHAEDEGLSLQQIKWLPLAVPLAALTMLLGAAAVLGTAG